MDVVKIYLRLFCFTYDMKISATIEIPRNNQNSVVVYATMRTPVGRMSVPGNKNLL